MTNLNQTDTDRILRALREARSKLEAIEQSRNERIAIIGMSGRFPGADNIKQFWDMICDRRSGIRTVTDEELIAAGIEPKEFQRSDYVRAYANISQPDGFDATFFGYSPREAEVIDPQHRVFLECAWSALEDAGYDTQRYHRDIGVFGGAALNSYLIDLHSNSQRRDSLDKVEVVVSNVMGLMPTRVSYKLNLTGPSYGIQTGCSTSLASVHLACQSLLNRECDLALAGGVTLTTATPEGYIYQSDGIASPDGHCRPFDVQAQGTVFGNGVGVVVLKPLQAALKDGDHIYAVIQGSAVNNDGAEKVGLTAPSVKGQAKVITQALTQAKIPPETIGYIETHGTGTALGDPIEVAALMQAFQSPPKAGSRCAIGSVKGNIGHLDAAAGVVGLIKATLALYHQTLPPNLDFEQPNPKINFSESPFYVQTEAKPWLRQGDIPLRAGVSSFGMGGTNAHVILEEAPQRGNGEIRRQGNNEDTQSWHILPLSAPTQTALEQATLNLAEHLKEHPEQDLSDIAYTLQVGRREWNQRCVCIVQTKEDAIAQLTGTHSLKPVIQQIPHPKPSVVFLFSGQGSQYDGMGKELYHSEPCFREAIDRCCQILDSLNREQGDITPNSFSDILFEKTDRLNETAYTQPALFAIEYALAQLWLSWGIEPQALLGHSIGEYSAACLAGVFSLEEGLALVAKRGQLMQNCPPGAMLSVALSESDTRNVLNSLAQELWENLTISVINSPQLCVVSGTRDAIAALQTHLESQEIHCQNLHTSHGFHSPLMESALAEFSADIAQIPLHPPQIDLISNVTGTWLTDREATNPDYWVRQMRQTVRFSEGVEQVSQISNPIYLEIGPGHTLSQLVKSHQPSSQGVVLNSLPHPKAQKQDSETLVESVAKLWFNGVTIDWQAFHYQAQRKRVSLPTYPFERHSYWVEPQVETIHETSLQKSDLSDWFYLPTWQRVMLKPSTEATGNACYLLFDDDSEFSKSLGQHLSQINVTCIWISTGEDFSHKDNQITINPKNPNDYDRLVKHLQAQSLTPSQVLHLWSLSAPADLEHLGFYSLLYFTQALDQNKWTNSLQIRVFTTGLYDVVGTETLNSDRATVLGACKVIPQEYPHLRCQNIDLSLSGHSNLLISSLIGEFSQKIETETVIAYREGHRWVQSFKPIHLPDPNLLTKAPALKGGDSWGECSLLREGGVYLIAGDLVEGLGTVFAQLLRQTADAKLVLVGRSGFPNPDTWEQWLATHSPNHEISRCIRRLQALGAVGEDFLWFSLDLTDEAEIKSVIDRAEKQFGQIQGVIHADAMGDRNSAAIAELNWEQCETIFRSKIKGLQVLESCLRDRLWQRSSSDRDLDFYLLQSSLSSIVGGVGFAAYAGANLYLDTLAAQRRQAALTKGKSTLWLSLNWDSCHLEETHKDSQQIDSTLLDTAMQPSEVHETTIRSLNLAYNQPTLAQLAISPTDLPTRIDQWIAHPETLQNEVNPTTQTRTHVSAEYVAPRNAIEQAVTEALAELLGLEKVGIQDNFFELGGHSLLAIQAITQLRQKFQVEIPMREFLFESPTAEGIAAMIDRYQPKPEENDQDEAALDISQMLEEIEAMNPEEVEKELRE